MPLEEEKLCFNQFLKYLRFSVEVYFMFYQVDSVATVWGPGSASWGLPLARHWEKKMWRAKGLHVNGFKHWVMENCSVYSVVTKSRIGAGHFTLLRDVRVTKSLESFLLYHSGSRRCVPSAYKVQFSPFPFPLLATQSATHCISTLPAWLGICVL